MKKYLLIVAVLFFLLGGILVYQNITFNDKKLHVVFCDVGQGDAIFVRTPQGSDILIDGGPDNSILNCLGEHMPFWDRTIEIMILTHPHADHLTGLIDVAKRYRVLSFGTEKIINPTSAYKELIKNLKNAQQKFLYQNDKFIIKDGTIFKTLWPTEGWIERNRGENADVNGSSVIEFLTYENFKVLFTGDAQAGVLERIGTLIGGLDLLKVPHHGSKTGLTAGILDILNPKLAAISVGKNNKYGHPAPFTLEILRNKDIKALRTDQTGDIEIISDGKTWKVN